MNNIRNTISVGSKVEYRSLLMSGMLPFPHVVLVKDGYEILISEKEITRKNAMPGNVACFNSEGDMIFVNLLNGGGIPNGYVAEAVVVLPSDQDPLGLGRVGCMSLNYIANNDSPSAAVNVERLNFSGVAVVEELGSVSYTDHGFLPSDLYKNGGTAGYSSEADGNLSPSPYDVNLMYNEVYSEEPPLPEGMEENIRMNVLGKYDSVLENGALMESRVSENTGVYQASLYSTSHILEGSWFLPSMYELGLLYNRIGIINDALTAVDNVDLVGCDADKPMLSWNGLVDNSGNACIWVLDACNGKVTYNILGQASEQGVTEGGSYNVRAFTYL